MAKTKAARNQIVTFEVAMKNRAVLTIDADEWNFDVYSVPSLARFFLNGDLVLALHPAKWEYIRRVGSRAKEEIEGGRD